MSSTKRVNETVLPSSWMVACKQDHDSELLRLNSELMKHAQRWWKLSNSLSIEIIWDKTTNLLWYYPNFGATSIVYATSEAESKCNDISKKIFSDWRIPECKELMTAVNASFPYKEGQN